MNSIRIRQQILGLATVICFFICGAAHAAVHETNFQYLPPTGLDSSAILAPPPILGSSEHIADMAQVVAVHKACSSNDAEIAYSEKKFSIFTFAPAIGGFFSSNNLPQTTAFMSRVQEEAATATDVAKNFWQRPRPYTIDTNLANGKLEKTFGYPSGHSTEGTVLALVLSELVPDKAEGITEIGREIGWHRVWIARHYPTDIYAGRTFARLIVLEMKKNGDFRKDLAGAKAEIEAARHGVPATANLQPVGQ